MERVDFIHLLRLSEQDSAENSQIYRRKVAIFAALGYLWVLACLGVSLGLLAWVGMSLYQPNAGRMVQGWILVVALGMLWSTISALWVRSSPCTDIELKPDDAPGLFEALERIRRKINGPVIHHVYLDAEFNASIRQLPRFGLLGGGSVNSLHLGLPLLMALERPRMLSILAHEYGHLRGNHGRLSAWIYRTRLAWMKLDENLQKSSSGGVWAFFSHFFFHWYFPRFAAKTFALARQDEYEADRISGQLLGASVASAALIEIEIKSAWLGAKFWHLHWSQAARSVTPIGPFVALCQQLILPPPADFVSGSLRAAMRSLSGIDDTHPVLRDRLEALGHKVQAPTWSRQSALGLLSDCAKWVALFDRQWCREHANIWKIRSVYFSRLRKRAAILATNAASHNANEIVEWVELERQLEPVFDGRKGYERALQLNPSHSGALIGLIQILAPSEQSVQLNLLEKLHEVSQDNRWWAAQYAINLLESELQEINVELLKNWRSRFKLAEQAETRAWQELMETSFFSRITRHDLSEFEKELLCAELQQCRAISRAWLVCKNLSEFSQRRAYVMFLELPRISDEARYTLCRELEHSLHLPGSVVVVWAGESPSLEEIERETFGLIWTRRAAV